MYHVSQKRPPFYFLNSSVKNWPILISFGMLNPEKIWHGHLIDLSTSLVRCGHFTLGKSKSHFSTLLFIYLRLLILSQKKTNSNCCTAASAVYLLLFSASYYLHSYSTELRLGYATGGARVLIRTCWGLASGLLRHWLNFSTAWCTMRLISVEKDWKHVLMQKVVTLNT